VGSAGPWIPQTGSGVRRRGVNNEGKKDPVRVLAIVTVRSPLVVDTVLSRVPLR